MTEREFDIEEKLAEWETSECLCTRGSSNPNCPLYQIIRSLRKEVSFEDFCQFKKRTSSIARLPGKRQTRLKYIKCISKCKSGFFYVPMDPNDINQDPSLYDDSDSEATPNSDDDATGSATEEYELPSDEEHPDTLTTLPENQPPKRARCMQIRRCIRRPRIWVNRQKRKMNPY